MSNYRDVYAFHAKFDLPRGYKNRPRELTPVELRERIEFMSEELSEFIDAVKAGDLPEQADALIDLVYVAIGTAIRLGLPWEKLWDDVHRANMDKVRGTTKRGHPVDVAKPEGWVGPHTLEILKGAGYDA